MVKNELNMSKGKLVDSYVSCIISIMTVNIGEYIVHRKE